MKIDFNKLREQMDSVNNSGKSGGSKYATVYPFQKGKIVLRLLYNPKAEMVQRFFYRHGSGKDKVTCLRTYGQECPVCSTVNELTDILGKEAGIGRTYGAKSRGACYAIVAQDTGYFPANGPKVGDVILFMYPKTVYDKINSILLEDEVNPQLFTAQNTGFSIAVNISSGTNGQTNYDVQPVTSVNGATEWFKSTNEKTGDEQFDELLCSLPDLRESCVPSAPTDDAYSKARCYADIIRQSYAKSNVVNPGGVPLNTVVTPPNVVNVGNYTGVNPNVGQSYTTANNNTAKPACFGGHVSGSDKCNACPYDADCFMQTN